MTNQWVWVSLSYATYGIAHNGTHITDAAPIAAWAIGKPKEEFIAWCYRKDPNVRFVKLY